MSSFIPESLRELATNAIQAGQEAVAVGIALSIAVVFLGSQVAGIVGNALTALRLVLSYRSEKEKQKHRLRMETKQDGLEEKQGRHLLGIDAKLDRLKLNEEAIAFGELWKRLESFKQNHKRQRELDQKDPTRRFCRYMGEHLQIMHMEEMLKRGPTNIRS